MQGKWLPTAHEGSSNLEVLCKNIYIKNLTKFTRNDLRRSLFLIKFNFIKKETLRNFYKHLLLLSTSGGFFYRNFLKLFSQITDQKTIESLTISLFHDFVRIMFLISGNLIIYYVLPWAPNNALKQSMKQIKQ